MNKLTLFRTIAPHAFLCIFLVMPYAARAAEQWEIREIFSNGNGELQYIMLSTQAGGQNDLGGMSITSRNTGGTDENTFTFPSDVEGATSDRSLLLGTPGLADHTGLAVDFEIPSGFVFRDGGSIDYAGVDSFDYENSQLPKNGLQALRNDHNVVDAAPENFSGESTLVEAPVASTFDPSTALVHLPVVDAAGVGTANATLSVTSDSPFQITLTAAYIYEQGIVPGETAPTLDESGLLHVPEIPVGDQLYEVNLTLIDDASFVFGELEVLDVTDPAPEPEPEPEPDPLQESIEAGAQVYSNQCATCHGSSGNGGALGPSLANSSLTTFDQLQPFIENNMPFGNPGNCTDSGNSSCATDTANFILHELQS